MPARMGRRFVRVAVVGGRVTIGYAKLRELFVRRARRMLDRRIDAPVAPDL